MYMKPNGLLVAALVAMAAILVSLAVVAVVAPGH
jgi:hypothetical protein